MLHDNFFGGKRKAFKSNKLDEHKLHVQHMHEHLHMPGCSKHPHMKISWLYFCLLFFIRFYNSHSIIIFFWRIYIRLIGYGTSVFNKNRYTSEDKNISYALRALVFNTQRIISYKFTNLKMKQIGNKARKR